MSMCVFSVCIICFVIVVINLVYLFNVQCNGHGVVNYFLLPMVSPCKCLLMYQLYE